MEHEVKNKGIDSEPDEEFLAVRGESARLMGHEGVRVYDRFTFAEVNPERLIPDGVYAVNEGEWLRFSSSPAGRDYFFLLGAITEAVAAYAEDLGLNNVAQVCREDLADTRSRAGEKPEYISGFLTEGFLMIYASRLTSPGSDEKETAAIITCFISDSDVRDVARAMLVKDAVKKKIGQEFTETLTRFNRDENKTRNEEALGAFEVVFKASVNEAIARELCPERCYLALAEEDAPLALMFDEYREKDSPYISDPCHAGCFIETYCQRFHPDVMGLGDGGAENNGDIPDYD